MAYKQGYHLPFPRVAVFLAAFWDWLVVLAPLSIGLFPDGRLTLRWRRAVAAYVLLSTVLLGWTSWANIGVFGDAAHQDRRHGGASERRQQPRPARPAAHPAFVGFCVAFVVKQVLAYRRSTR